jgi:hypothetical protein
LLCISAERVERMDLAIGDAIVMAIVLTAIGAVVAIMITGVPASTTRHQSDSS